MTSQLNKVEHRQTLDHVTEAYSLSREPIEASPERTPKVSDQLLITLPVHNEASRLERNVGELERFLEKEGLTSTIILAEDGSTDNSALICSELARKYNNIMLSRRWARLGRGKAMREAWSGLNGLPFNYCMFMDADLATDLSALKSMLRELEAGNDLVVGSRYITGSKVVRPRLRLGVSLVYNKIV